MLFHIKGKSYATQFISIPLLWTINNTYVTKIRHDIWVNAFVAVNLTCVGVDVFSASMAIGHDLCVALFGSLDLHPLRSICCSQQKKNYEKKTLYFESCGLAYLMMNKYFVSLSIYSLEVRKTQWL